MRVLLLILIGLICGYHILLTGLAVHRPEMRVYLPLIRDALWVALVVVVSLMAVWKTNLRTVVWPFVKYMRPLVIAIIGFLIWAILQTTLVGGSRQHMGIGIKYDIWFFFLGGLAVAGGRRWGIVHGSKAASEHKKENTNQLHIEHIRGYVRWGVLMLIIGGFLWQGAKLIRPDMFMHFGYGPVGDYAYGTNPPIRYRTGPGGTMRRSGIFAGPNNYGYFLVCFFGFFVVSAKHILQKTWNTLSRKQHMLFTGISIAIYILAVLATFSRGAIIGCFVQLIVLAWRLKKLRPLIGIASIAALFGIGVLSSIKRSSTLEHFQRTTQGIELVLQQPRGYGLGSAGPAIHRGGKYLPENIYVQVLLDTGRIGFVLRVGAWLRWLMRGARIALRSGSLVMRGMRAGFVGLSIEGIFLHVREDSMVNMLFFGVRGVALGIEMYSYYQKNTLTDGKSVVRTTHI